jgi:PTH1 family peptidyl-tRNA hydrolase
MPAVRGRVPAIEARLGNSPVLLFKPRASMNRSGAQLRNYLDSIERSLADCIIVYDDFDLPLGEFRSRNRGGDGGHKGVQSIIIAFGTAEFRRLRIGVRAEGDVRKAQGLVLSVLDAQRADSLLGSEPCRICCGRPVDRDVEAWTGRAHDVRRRAFTTVERCPNERGIVPFGT